MFLLDEKYTVKDFLERLPVWVNMAGWGTAVWTKEKQQELLKKFQAMNPDDVTADIIAEIMGTRYYAEPHECEVCRQASWDIVSIESHESYNSNFGGICMCQDCLEKALAIVKK